MGGATGRDRSKWAAGQAAPAYTVADGREDRHGEMTGAISVNMALSMLPVGLWCFYVGHWFGGFRTVVKVGLLLAVVLPIVCQPLSRRVWAWLSHRAESW